MAAWHSSLLCEAPRFIVSSLVSGLARFLMRRSIAHMKLLDASHDSTDHSMQACASTNSQADPLLFDKLLLASAIDPGS